MRHDPARELRSLLLPAILLAPLLLAGCGADSRAGEPGAGADADVQAAEPGPRSGTDVQGDEVGSEPPAAGSVEEEPPRDTGAVVVREGGLLVNTAHDFALELPPGVTLADAAPSGDRFTLALEGERFLYASVARGRSLDPEALAPGTEPGWALALLRARAACAADGPESSIHCTGPVAHDPLEAWTGRPIEAFTLRHVHEDFGHEGPTRVTLGEAGPFYWIRFDPGPDGLRGLLVHGRTDGVMGGEAQTAARALLESYRQPVEGLEAGEGRDGPPAPAAFLTLDGVIPMRGEPREGAARVGAIGPMTVVRPTGRVEVGAGSGEPSPPWYEVEVDGARGWVPADEVAEFVRASWDGRRLLFRSGSTVDGSSYWFLTVREGRSLGAFRTEEGHLVSPSPSLERYAVLKRPPGARVGALEVHDPTRRVLVYAAYDARGPRWSGERLHYQRSWEDPETGETEFGDAAYDPPAVPDAGTPVLLLRRVLALATPEIMVGEAVGELPEGAVVKTTGAAEGALVSYGDAGSSSGLWLEVHMPGGEAAWVPAEALGILVEGGENGLFRAATRPGRWLVRAEPHAGGVAPFAIYELEDGERLDCYRNNRWCFVDHGGDPTGTFTLVHGPTGEEAFSAEYVGTAPYWVREETVAYYEIVGGVTEEGWIPADYEEVGGRR